MDNKYKIVLASKSEQRIEFMKKEGYDFVIMPSNFELEINDKKYTDDLLKKCVQGKLEDVKNRIFNINSNDAKDNNMNEDEIIDGIDKKDFYIIAADTVVVLNGIIIGKPKDRDDAIRILSSLSGNTHFVATGVEVMHVISDKNIIDNFDIQKSYVTFRELTKEDIEEYLDKRNPYDKAGAYGIQDPEFNFDIKIDGPIDNVIGLPMDIVKKFIKK